MFILVLWLGMQPTANPVASVYGYSSLDECQAESQKILADLPEKSAFSDCVNVPQGTVYIRAKGSDWNLMIPIGVNND